MIGVKFIPLRTHGGESTSHIGVFVKIEIKQLRHKEASSSGRCPQELDLPVKKFSSSKLPETCYYSESLECVDQGENHDQRTTHLVSNNSANGGHRLLGGPQLFRQRAINESTVEVHLENNLTLDAEDSTDT